uniref:Pentacotripeptide-repeat region of PRORP domain-containing protein n=1 Tax=Entomoneis paludosa TaxID=265537 RepID=A0A7S2YMD2_9STRA|mmetsp:Transcript_39151/g.81267  ORF Transcript_39151/g.81267 Transcript_39151/m.81267 type:complete len:902 (+) Transcript_39151:152-2857(+)
MNTPSSSITLLLVLLVVISGILESHGLLPNPNTNSRKNGARTRISTAPDVSFPFLSVQQDESPGNEDTRESSTIASSPATLQSTASRIANKHPPQYGQNQKKSFKSHQPRNDYDDDEAMDESPDSFSRINRPSFRELERNATALIRDTAVGSWNSTTVETATTLCVSLSKMSFRHSIILVEKIIHRMVQEQSVGNDNVGAKQMTPLYESLIMAWAKSGEVGGPERAEEILEYMVMNSEEGDDDGTNGEDDEDEVELSSCNKYGHDDIPEVETMVTSLLPKITYNQLRPGRESLNVVLWAHARSSQSHAHVKATQLLSKWYKWYNDGLCWVAPNAISYSAILYALAKHDPTLQQGQGDFDMPSFSKQKTRSTKTYRGDTRPHYKSANGPNYDAPKIVLDLLFQMEKLSEQYPSVKPDLSCYHKYFVAIQEASSRYQISGKKGAILAEQHLERMLKHSDPAIHPDSWAFNAVIRTWTHSNSPDCIERCENLIKLQEDYHKAKGFSNETIPLVHSYNLLIDCYARSRLPDRMKRAEGLLRRLEERAQQSDGALSAQVRPNSYTYNGVLNTLAKSGRVRAPELAEKLLLEMDRKQKEGDPFVRVSVRSVNVCLNAWAKSGRKTAPSKIKGWIDKMREMALSGKRVFAPNRVTYNTYLHALSKSSVPDSCDLAEAVLPEMYEQHEQGFMDVEPDIITFTNVLHTFSTSGAADSLNRSLALLDQLEELHANGKGNVRPSRLTYNCCVNAAAKSPTPGKAAIAEQLLRRMQSVALKAETITYNSVLNACAYSVHPDDSPEEVLRIAFRILDEVRLKSGANHITYMTMLRVVNSQVNDEAEKWQLVRNIVNLCATDGQLTNQVMHGARLNVAPKKYYNLRNKFIDGHTGDYKDKYKENVEDCWIKRFEE